MATTMTEPATATSKLKRYHEFHAQAHVLHGELMRPIQQTIERHSYVELKDERGGHLTRFSEDVNLEGLISLHTAHTRVSGSMTIKRKGWLTTSTSVVEGLNVFEVITADRVVSQVSTDHPYDRTQEPHVSFLGTKFENLKVCGIPVGVTYKFDVCGAVKDDDQSFLSNPFATAKEKEYDAISKADYLSDEVKKRYHDMSLEARTISTKLTEKTDCKVTCSLITKIHIEELSKQVEGVRAVGNLLFIPNFGAVALGEIEVGMQREPVSSAFRRHEMEVGGPDQLNKLSNYFQITMLNIHLGCVGHGNVQVASGKSNGNTAP
jgi:hypothetical protein